MVAAARHDAILRELELRGSLVNTGFARRLGVTSMTLRRDVEDLHRRGLLVRVHGGAVSLAVAQQQSADVAGYGPRRTRPVATIGMIVPTTEYYFPEIIRGASRAAAEANCRLVVGATNYSPDEELRQARRMLESGVDGLLITPHGALEADSSLLQVLRDARVPIVLVERDAEDRVQDLFAMVRSDHAYGAELGIRHLVALGHRRIALATRPSATASGLDEGFRRGMVAVGEDGFALRGALSDPLVGERVAVAGLGAFLDQCIEHAVTAVMLLGDADSMAFTELVLARGLRIPEDIAVVAYDDEVASLAAVPLTAVAPLKRDLGRSGVRLCFDQLRRARGDAGTVVRSVLMPELVVRESTVPQELV
ncbi:substrate-binding domain-containing protein [Microbacterium sp. 22303]|uniref:LacI family DNA-binding transcriptional regulator n=1 Tax=Microbacterium sp. 22303 TaxID=3453905 RepID=UPI003F8480FB